MCQYCGMGKNQGPDADDARFAVNMQRRREELGISQADLVRDLRANGWATVHPTTISRIENGDRPVRLGEARAIARALDTGVDHFLLSPAESRLAGELMDRAGEVRAAWHRISATTVKFLIERVELEGVIGRAQTEGVRTAESRMAGERASVDSGNDLESALEEAIQVVELEAIEAVSQGQSEFERHRGTGKGRAGEA